LEYRDLLVARLGLADVRSIRPDPADLVRADELWRTNPDACCNLRKVLPLQRAAEPFAVLVDGRKRIHGADRADLSAIGEAPNGKISVSPLASWGMDRIEAAFSRSNLPAHPLVGEGYSSIGCWPCTRSTKPGETVRAGRWAGQGKTECGIHVRG
jgi:phosphoadenosine phosphosulfate reductase